MSATEKASLTAEPQQDRSLLVKAGGSWSVHGSPPTLERIIPALAGTGTGCSVRFDLSGLEAWDSSLVALILDLVKRCGQQGLKVDMGSLPDGIGRLVTMAVAVPERNTPRTPEKTLFFTRLGKAGISLGASVMEVFAFLGVITLALGRLLRGRAVFRWSDTWLIVQR